MKFEIFLLLFVICLMPNNPFLLNSVKCFNENFTLINVIQINRHGARTPKAYVKMQEKLFFGAAKMQLTINGYSQEQSLGKFMRKRYIEENKLIGGEYDKKDFFIFSSPIQRTIYSAAGFISGLFPGLTIRPLVGKPGKRKKNVYNLLKRNDEVPQLKNIFTKEKFIKSDTNQQINNFQNVNKSEIQLLISNPRNDRLFHPFKCKYNNEKFKNQIKRDFKSIKKEFTPIFKIEDEDLQKAFLDLKKFFLNDNYKEKVHKKISKNFKIGNNFKKEFKNLAKFYTTYSYHFNNTSFADNFHLKNLKKKSHNRDHILNRETINTIKKMILNKRYNILYLLYNKKFNENQINNKYTLQVSELFDIIKSTFEKAVSNVNIEKYKVYSGHDTNLINMLLVLLDRDFIVNGLQKCLADENYFNFFSPEFGSYMTYELYKDQNDNYFVKIIYNGIELRNLRGNISHYSDGKIKLDEFLNLMKILINKNYTKLKCY